MKWKDLPELPQFYDRYIKQVTDQPLLDALRTHEPTAIMADMDKLAQLGDQVYEPGKWTIKTVIQHMIDTERIMAYRALCIARKDKTILPGFDENSYADNTSHLQNNLEDLVNEWQILRVSNILLFRSMSEEMLLTKGQASNKIITPAALGFVICGHPIHHYNVIKERYFPILGN